jgi:hypothetical protein
MSHSPALRATTLVLLLAAACSDSKPDAGEPDGGIALDAITYADAVVAPDVLPLRPDASLVVPHDGGGSASCTVTCDCPQGLACVNNVCEALVNPVYCCDKPACPGGQVCLDLAERPDSCPTPPDAGPDAGAPDLGSGYVGANCEQDTDCTQVPGMTCWTRDEAPFIWGYCTVQDCVVDGDCPMGARCLGFNVGGPVPLTGCLQECLTDSSCRSDAFCLPIATVGFSVCLPDCRDDLLDCGPRDGTQWCNRTSGQCEANNTSNQNADVGDACISNQDCGAGDVCMGEIGLGFPGGLCTHVCSGLPESTPCSVNETCQDFLGIGLCFRDCVGTTCPSRATATCGILEASWLQPSCFPL